MPGFRRICDAAFSETCVIPRKRCCAAGVKNCAMRRRAPRCHAATFQIDTSQTKILRAESPAGKLNAPVKTLCTENLDLLHQGLCTAGLLLILGPWIKLTSCKLRSVGSNFLGSCLCYNGRETLSGETGCGEMRLARGRAVSGRLSCGHARDSA